MHINDAQKEMRHAYLGGSAGMFVSGLVWLISGFVGYFVSVQASVITLFLGGMLIHPLGLAISKLMKRSGTHDKSNPLGALAMESTVLLFIGLFIAFVVVQIETSFFFPIMLLTIGGRYIIFATLYGLRIYWVVGGILTLVLCKVSLFANSSYS